MAFQNELVRQRKLKGVSQEQLGKNIGVSQTTISDYEAGRDVPRNNAYRMSKVLDSSRLFAEYCFEYKTSFFNVPVLNSVDDHEIVGMSILIEEAAELISNIEKLRKLVINKRDRRSINKEEWIQLMHHEEQILDILPAVQMHLIEMSEVFGLDLEKLEWNVEKKLIRKGYYTKRKDPHSNADPTSI